MSEEAPKIVKQAFAEVRRDHVDDINTTKAKQTSEWSGGGIEGAARKKRSYDYNGGNLREVYQHDGDQYDDGKDTYVEENVSGNDSSLERRMKRWHNQDGLNEATDQYSVAETTIPTSEGSASYKADKAATDYSDGTSTDSSETTIARKDASGNEVYKFTSKNPDMADKVASVAAKRIIQSVSDNQLDKAA